MPHVNCMNNILGMSSLNLANQLEVGQDLVLEDGEVLKYDEVVTPKQACIIIDCPSMEVAERLTMQKKLNPREDNFTRVPYIFHFTDEEVAQLPAYREWMAKFTNSKHVMLKSDNLVELGKPKLGNERYLVKMHRLAPTLFPEGGLQPDPHHVPSDEESQPDEVGQRKRHFIVIDATNGVARPKIPGDAPADLGVLDIAGSPDDEELLAELLKEAGAKRARLDEMKELATAPEFPKITFLGTGSSAPSKYRAQSALLIEVERDVFFLLDCGDGESSLKFVLL